MHLAFTQEQPRPQDGEDGAELEKGGHIPNEAKRNGGEAKKRGDSWEARWRRKEHMDGHEAPAGVPWWEMASPTERGTMPQG